ncbi:hypothetical protein A6764_01530 [Brevibacillus sp. WF146]|uniref:hypothetical protein n=1 Tax=Brevibacillus sp. WF146 TaxID=319501 RepID=UPI0007EC9C25|nr:hypothetical protein [Brevibacillus sp. WF146]UYZ13695.1 hypothetical protein A6764_01530 [Brevibacillus sp. WF146]
MDATQADDSAPNVLTSMRKKESHPAAKKGMGKSAEEKSARRPLYERRPIRILEYTQLIIDVVPVRVACFPWKGRSGVRVETEEITFSQRTRSDSSKRAAGSLGFLFAGTSVAAGSM